MLKQTFMTLMGLGWVKLLALTTAVVVPVGTGTYLYLQHNSTPGATQSPTASTSSPTSSQSQNSGSTPNSESKPSTTAPKTTPKPSSTPSSTSVQTPAPNTPPASTPTTPPTTPPAGSTACSNPTWSTSAHFGTWDTNGYLVNNNMWNEGEAGSQTLSACAWNNWYIVSNQPGAGTDDSVKTYPDVQKLVDIPLNNMHTITSSWEVSTPSGGGQVKPNSKQWNAAYDVWLDDYNTEVMVWTNWTANWQYWYGVYHGSEVTIDGVTYYTYYDGTEAMWFIRKNVTNTGSVNLKAIFQWAMGQGWLKNNQSINAIEYGFEVLYTGEPTRFDLLNYSLTAN